MARTRNYSDFLSSVTALIGVPVSRLNTEQAELINQFFNNSVRDVWLATQWHDTCPKGEARFVGNRLTYPNDLSKTANWTATALTITGDQLVNPLDGRVTASKLLETAASSEHKAAQTVSSFFPSTGYTCSAYVRPNGRSYFQMVVSDGATTYSAFFNVSAGTVGTTSNTTGTNISLQPNGFYLCQLTFTSSASATTSGSYTLKVSTDGSTVSYAGDTSKGVYVWGAMVQQTTNVPVSDLIIPWEQTGESVIEAVFDVFQSSPAGAVYPRRQGYLLTGDGVQIINATFTSYTAGVNMTSIYGTLNVNPVFLSYRKYMPKYSGDVYSATASYSVGEQIYFTDSSDNGNFYKCLVATSPGQSPSTNASYWELIPLYNSFFQFCVYRSFADWLTQDGGGERAKQYYQMAEVKLADAVEVQERQMGDVLPTKFHTHLTSRSR